MCAKVEKPRLKKRTLKKTARTVEKSLLALVGIAFSFLHSTSSVSKNAVQIVQKNTTFHCQASSESARDLGMPAAFQPEYVANAHSH
jgi:ABC-type branched-subunit amino acid transport system substrate-binding protein